MRDCFEGDVRIFICINTVNYNEDGKYAVTRVSYDELEDIGFGLDEAYPIVNTERMVKVDDMQIGEIVEAQRDAFLMRVPMYTGEAWHLWGKALRMADDLAAEGYDIRGPLVQFLCDNA